MITKNQKRIAIYIAIVLSIAGCRKVEREVTTDQRLSPYTRSDANPLIAISGLNPFKVMSFNVRHNDLNDSLSILQRAPLIKQIIIDNSPDIFGCQEYSDNDFSFPFANEMATLGYGVYFDEVASGAGNPRVIFFKNSRFTMEGNGTWAIGGGNTATWVVLLDKVTSKKYFVSNSHWQYDSAVVRIANARNLAIGINTYNTQNLPKIVFGDFNAVPGTAEIDTLKNRIDLVDALNENIGGPTFHGWTGNGIKKTDWMMSDRSMAFLSWQVIKTRYLVDGRARWPSDHWPIMATYVPAVLGGTHTDANGGSAVATTNYSFADVNGDGKDDKIFWRYNYDSGKVRVFLSNGNGTFADAVTHAQSASLKTTTRFYFADVNGDQKADLIKWDYDLNSGHTLVYLATSNGSFSTTVIDNGSGPSGVAATVYNFADVNGDGMADKIFWRHNFDSGRTRVYLAIGGGQFSTAVQAGTAGASEIAGTMFWYARLNNDNYADKILWHPTANGGQTMAFLSNGDGFFTASPGFSSGATSGQSDTKFYFADIDGDGLADKVYWNPDEYLGKLKVYFAQANNTFQGPVYSLRGTSQSANTQFFFADISGPVAGLRKADQIRWNYAEDGGTMKNYFGN